MASSSLHQAEVVHVKQKEAEAIFVGVAKGPVTLDNMVASRQHGLSQVAPVIEALLTTKLLALRAAACMQRPGTRLSRHKGHYKFHPRGYAGCKPHVRVSELGVYLGALYTCKPGVYTCVKIVPLNTGGITHM